MSSSGSDQPPRSPAQPARRDRSGRHAPAAATPSAPQDDNHTGLHMCMALIQNESGLTWTPDQVDLVASRLRDFAAQRHCATLLDLYFHLRYHPDGSAATKELVSQLTVNETSFFRGAAQWEQFAKILVEEILEVGGEPHRQKLVLPRPLKIWSAGCSSGEEPYTALLTLLECGLEPAQFHISGWDIHAAMIEKARRAEFPNWTLRRVPPKLLAKYFQTAQPGEYRLAPQAASAVEFQCENLLSESAEFPTGLDFIFCRNVLIYFSPEDVRRLVRRFFAALQPGGVLFLSPTESLVNHPGDFETVVGKNSVCYRKPRATKSQPPGA